MKVLVVDNGQSVAFARTLGQSNLFERVGYYASWQEDTPVAQEMAIGSGFPEIVREYDLFDALDAYDCIACPVLFWDGLQRWCRKRGIPCWGAGETEHLERDRAKLLATMTALGMSTPAWEHRTLPDIKPDIEEGDIVKFSTFRGDVETTKHDGDWTWYYETMLRWGPLAESIKAVWQKPLPKGVEPGFDLLVVRGEVLEPFSVGYEVKDGGYIEKNMLLHEMPQQFRAIYKGIKQMISKDYSNFLSTEILSETLLDITCRIPQPPGDLKLFMWEGLSEIIHDHFSNLPYQLRHTEPRDTWGVQLIAHNNNPKNFCRFGTIPRDIRPFVFFNRAFMVDDCVWTAPWKDRSVQDWVDAATVVGSGRSPEEAISEAQRIADELHMPNGVLIDSGTTEALMKALEDGEKEGIAL